MTQTVYFRGGNSLDELVCVVLMRDGVPMRYFPIAAKGDVHVPLRVVEDLAPGTVLKLHASCAGRRRRNPRHRSRPRGGVNVPRHGRNGAGNDGKRRLVVVGNGMAGARTVEEILERDGAGQFAITMFGDEPYGNYNRIMLSNVLAGIEDAGEAIFAQPAGVVRRERR